VVSGRIAGIAADPTTPNTIYVATAGGGAWKTTDAGVNWNALTDTQQTLTKWFSLIILPACIFGVGVISWSRRRR